jgi:two-component system, OmpR family, phosphate regulon response regulator PhoB
MAKIRGDAVIEPSLIVNTMTPEQPMRHNPADGRDRGRSRQRTGTDHRTQKAMTTILVVDDEPDIREVIRFALENAEYRVIEAGHADEARKLMTNENPDLVLLDWMLPGRSGLELAQQLKQNPKSRALPIIMVSARGEEEDRIKGLDTGADDYIAKPFSPREMVARVKAVLRRTKPEETVDEIELGGLRIDNISHRVTAGGRPIEIAPTEYRLLHFFMTHADRAFSRSQLLDQVWGDQVYVEERTVDVHVRRLRKALERSRHDRLLQTVRGVGYRFSDKT